MGEDGGDDDGLDGGVDVLGVAVAAAGGGGARLHEAVGAGGDGPAAGDAEFVGGEPLQDAEAAAQRLRFAVVGAHAQS